MKMDIFPCVLLSFDWQRQACNKQILMMFYRSFKEPIFLLVAGEKYPALQKAAGTTNYNINRK
jgi:hypothetical protein